MNSLVNNDKKARVSILHYDETMHRMDPDIHVESTTDTNIHENNQAVNDSVDTAATFEPSAKWKEEYAHWNCLGCGPPMFHTIKELRRFNQKGTELVHKLRKEFRGNKNIVINDFTPLYSNVAVGDAVCGWWHVKDMDYGVVIPIQKLPVSDLLKSRLVVWKSMKGKGWDDPIQLDELDHEAHDLEEHLLWELNVDMAKEGKPKWKFHKNIPLSEIHLCASVK